MPSEKSLLGRPLRRILSNHNPLYLLSAWLVLHGISLAFQGEAGLRWVPLMTQMLCGYTLMLALAGWMVVRVGKIWEDARMILLVVLLMFTALSTSYDDLCLKDPAVGAMHLSIGLAFCITVTEMVLYLLGIRLPVLYRLPFYLQLAVLFAFPGVLGKLSVDGRDPEMCLGVLMFPVAAGLALLTLLPAAMRAGERDRDNGTPWPWPMFPWSMFVFVAIASGIRAWMLSVSFTPAAGVAPAFMPYFLCPILLAMLILGLEMGLREQSRPTQWSAQLMMFGVILLSFPGEGLSGAQALTLGLLERSAAGPPLLVGLAVSMLAIYGMFRRAAGSELLAVVSLSLLACLNVETRSLHNLEAPNAALLAALAGWQLTRGLWNGGTLSTAYGGIAAIIVAGLVFNADWLFEDDCSWLVQLSLVLCAIVPLVCRDDLAEFLRDLGPFALAAAATWVVVYGPAVWRHTLPWAPALTASGLALVGMCYWLAIRRRWYLPASVWAAGMAALLWLICGFRLLDDGQLKLGLAWYASGCLMLLVALATTLWKAGTMRLVWQWLQSGPEQPQNGVAPGG